MHLNNTSVNRAFDRLENTYFIALMTNKKGHIHLQVQRVIALITCFVLNWHANLVSNEWTLKNLNCIYSEVNMAHVSSCFSRIMVKACWNFSRRFKARGCLLCLVFGSTGWMKRISNCFSGVVTTFRENIICLWNIFIFNYYFILIFFSGMLSDCDDAT